MFAPASGEQSNLEAHFVVVPVGSQNIRAEAHRPVLLIGVQLLAAAATAALFCEYVPQIVVVPTFGFFHTPRLALVSLQRPGGSWRAPNSSSHRIPTVRIGSKLFISVDSLAVL